jgi:hypothetical protein
MQAMVGYEGLAQQVLLSVHDKRPVASLRWRAGDTFIDGVAGHA